MTNRTCSISDCHKPHERRGYCSFHAYRFVKYGDPQHETPRGEALFWSWVDRRGPDDCWPWTGYRDSHGYGSARAVGVRNRRPASRVAFFYTYGFWPRVVRHSCDNPPCCNPAHLLPGDQKANAADRERHGRSARGEGNGHARLCEADVRAIKSRLRAGTLQRVLAVEYGVSTSMISFIATGQHWGHVA